MARQINDRISEAIWNVLQSSLFGYKAGLYGNSHEDEGIVLASPYVVDINNPNFRLQGIMTELLGAEEKRGLQTFSDLLISLSQSGAEVGLMTAPTGSTRFGKTNREMNEREEILLQKLEAGGVEIKMHPSNHSKFISSPMAELSMSSNLTNRALFWQFEAATYYSPLDSGYTQAKMSNRDIWGQGAIISHDQ